MQRKDELDESNKRLELQLGDERLKVSGLLEKLEETNIRYKLQEDSYKLKLQALEDENHMLKEQLRKYVNAVQLVKSHNSHKSIIIEPALAESYVEEKQPEDQTCNSETEQYERKLIQV